MSNLVLPNVLGTAVGLLLVGIVAGIIKIIKLNECGESTTSLIKVLYEG